MPKGHLKRAFAVSQYSGPLNPVIQSGASGLPPPRFPRLDRAVQKTAFATTYSAGPSPDWAHATAPSSGASLLPPARVPRLDRAVQKTAAGAPTRGNFMMASDLPGFRPPRLDRAIQKDGELETEPRVDIFKGAKLEKKEEPKKVKAGDMLPDYVTYSPNDFKRSKYAMPTEKMAEFVEGLLKEASSDEPGPNGEPPMSHEEFMKAFRSPGEVAALKRKERLGLGVLGSTAALGTAALAARHFMKKTAIPGLTPQSRLEQSSGIGAPRAAAPAAPGPSIADQAKPKGPGFGTGIAGANKGTIGGTNIGGIGNMASVPQL